MSLYLNVKQLVIGDIVELKANQIIPCDFLILKGSCLVNEALLNGESVPILKQGMDLQPILKQGMDLQNMKKKNLMKHYLYGGT